MTGGSCADVGVYPSGVELPFEHYVLSLHGRKSHIFEGQHPSFCFLPSPFLDPLSAFGSVALVVEADLRRRQSERIHCGGEPRTLDNRLEQFRDLLFENQSVPCIHRVGATPSIFGVILSELFKGRFEG
jgi:hypothetical protein